MNVTAVLVTRGDVDLSQIIDSIAEAGVPRIVIWDNSVRDDLAVYGRYAAIAEAEGDLIYVQDDDVLHTPEGIREMIDRWHDALGREWDHVLGGGVVCNMPANFRHAFYQEHALVGFGAVFQRDLPFEAFERFAAAHNSTPVDLLQRVALNDSFRRTCDIVFTALTPRVLVDVPYQDMPWASADNRMWKQPTHREERGRMLDLVLQVRDAA